ncbi:MAG: hypothetical protein WCO56_01535 [Verrucomicrobiota bacterium]
MEQLTAKPEPPKQIYPLFKEIAEQWLCSIKHTAGNSQQSGFEDRHKMLYANGTLAGTT